MTPCIELLTLFQRHEYAVRVIFFLSSKLMCLRFQTMAAVWRLAIMRPFDEAPHGILQLFTTTVD